MAAPKNNNGGQCQLLVFLWYAELLFTAVKSFPFSIPIEELNFEAQVKLPEIWGKMNTT